MKKWGFLSLLTLILFVIFVVKFNNQASNLPNGLHHVVSERGEQLIQQAKTNGIDIMITDDFRSFKEQNRLYAKGRTKEGQIVTHAQGGESYHNYGLAIDFAILNQQGQPIWDMSFDGNENGEADWLDVVDIAKELGFEWGGDWESFKDYPHLQMNFGLSIHDLQSGERPSEESLFAGE